MLSIYKNTRTGHTYQTQKKGFQYAVVELDYWGKVVNTIGLYDKRRRAEDVLSKLADKMEWIWCGKQAQKRGASCTPGKDCFTCPYEDCIKGEARKSNFTNQEETRMVKIGRKSRCGQKGKEVKQGNAGKIRFFVEIKTGEATTRKMGKDELEAMLAREYGEKLAPIKPTRPKPRIKGY